MAPQKITSSQREGATRGKGSYQTSENNEQDGNTESLPINNYFTWKRDQIIRSRGTAWLTGWTRPRGQCHLRETPALVGMSVGAASVERSMGVPHKVKSRTTVQSNNSIAEYFPKANENVHLKGQTWSCVYGSTTCHGGERGPAHASVCSQMHVPIKVVHTHNGTFLSHEKGDLATCHNRDEPRGITLTEGSQTEKGFHVHVVEKTQTHKETETYS